METRQSKHINKEMVKRGNNNYYGMVVERLGDRKHLARHEMEKYLGDRMNMIKMDKAV